MAGYDVLERSEPLFLIAGLAIGVVGLVVTLAGGIRQSLAAPAGPEHAGDGDEEF